MTIQADLITLQRRTRREASRRDDGTAITTTQSASIINPMNSNTRASTAMSPNPIDRLLGAN
jgi:hypothetical protein